MSDPRSSHGRRALTYSVLAHGVVLLGAAAAIGCRRPAAARSARRHADPASTETEEGGGRLAGAVRGTTRPDSDRFAADGAGPGDGAEPDPDRTTAGRGSGSKHRRGSGAGQGGQGSGTGRGIGPGSEDDYVERLRRHFNARSRSVEAPYDAPRYIQVRVVALIDQTGLLLRAEIQDGSGLWPSRPGRARPAPRHVAVSGAPVRAAPALPDHHAADLPDRPVLSGKAQIPATLYKSAPGPAGPGPRALKNPAECREVRPSLCLTGRGLARRTPPPFGAGM